MGARPFPDGRPGRKRCRAVAPAAVATTLPPSETHCISELSDSTQGVNLGSRTFKCRRRRGTWVNSGVDAHRLPAVGHRTAARPVDVPETMADLHGGGDAG